MCIARTGIEIVDGISNAGRTNSAGNRCVDVAGDIGDYLNAKFRLRHILKRKQHRSSWIPERARHQYIGYASEVAEAAVITVGVLVEFGAIKSATFNSVVVVAAMQLNVHRLS